VKGPPGIALNVDGQNVTLPAVLESVVGIERTIQVPEIQRVGDTIHRFSQWSDGAANRPAPLSRPTPRCGVW
jgi:hypothetical protein